MLSKPKSVRPRERRYVTIAAGIVGSDGLILAADSLETVDDYLKVFRPKLVALPLVSEELKCVIAGSGTGPFIDMLVERISEKLDHANPYIASAKQSIQEAITQICNEVWPHYVTENDKPQASLLIGIRGNDGFSLLEAAVPMINTVERFSYIGFGRVLALYKSKQLMPEKLPIDVAVPLVAHILDVVKQNVEKCGGETNIVTMTADGSVEHKTQEFIVDAEKGYSNVAWAIDTFVLPALPLALTAEGKGLLSVIAALGEPKEELKSVFRNSLIDLVANTKAGISTQTPQDHAKTAATLTFFATSMLRDSVINNLAEAGLLSEAQREKFHKTADLFARFSLASLTAYRVNRADMGDKGLGALIQIVEKAFPDANLPLIDQALKSLPKT
jgi:hypothetical protein